MLAVRDGDLSSLGMLFERYHTALFDFLSRMTGDRTAAEDLVQDVFVRVLKYRATYREGGRFETWVFRIARNARADYFRKRRSTETVDTQEIEVPADSRGPADDFASRREVERLQRALLLLREDRRELIVLTRYRGMKHDAIADLLGVDAGTVKVRLHRALKELREIFLNLAERPSCDVKTSSRTLSII